MQEPDDRVLFDLSEIFVIISDRQEIRVWGVDRDDGVTFPSYIRNAGSACARHSKAERTRAGGMPRSKEF